MRYVYAFDEEAPGGRELLGGKGVGLAEMTALGVPVPAGFTITTDACRATMAAGEVPDGLDAEVDEHVASLEERSRQAVRRPVRPAARLGPLGRRGLDARDDGHDPQPRAQRRRRRGARRGHRQPAVRLRLVPAADPDVRRGRRRDRRPRCSRARSGAEGARAACGRTSSSTADDLRELVATFKAIYEREVRDAVPAGCPRAAPPARPRRLRLVGHRRARRSTAARTRSRTTSAPPSTSSRWCSATRATPRAPVSASPATRRRARRALRRVPRQRAGRGRRRGDPHPRADRADARAAARGVRPARRDARPARGALPRHAGHRVHGRGRRALPAPDAHREAHRAGRAAGRGRDGRRGADHAARRRSRGSTRASSTSSSTR